MEIYFGWYLFIPVILYMLRGYSSLQTINALGYSRKCTFGRGFLYILPEMLLVCLWCMMDIHLTVFYVLAFACHAFRWCLKRDEWSRGFFMASLVQPLLMAFHMILIGLAAMFIKLPMGILLHQPLWRMVTISVVTGTSILADIIILIWPRLREVLQIQALIEEQRSFMIFLWFCNIFLLLDSLLCMAQIQWPLLPLLLIGAAALKEFYILRCLFHLNAIIKERHIEEQHRLLEQKLAQQEQRTQALKYKSDRDALTGLYSRQYLMEQMAMLLDNKQQFSLAFIDLDGLKRVNDSQGHGAGDRYLKEFSQFILGQLRVQDIFARIGGDEFVILFLDCDGADATARLERMRTHILEGQFEHVPSFSFGVSQVHKDTKESAHQLLEAADANMYHDKALRRL